MRHSAFIFLWCAVLLAGCATHKDAVFVSTFQPTFPEHDYFFYFPEADFTKGESGVCKIHGVQMTREVVPVIYGMRLLPMELQAQAEYELAHFPNAKTNCWPGCVDGGFKQARIFVCAECQQREKDWIASGP